MTTSVNKNKFVERQKGITVNTRREGLASPDIVNEMMRIESSINKRVDSKATSFGPGP